MSQTVHGPDGLPTPGPLSIEPVAIEPTDKKEGSGGKVQTDQTAEPILARTSVPPTDGPGTNAGPEVIVISDDDSLGDEEQVHEKRDHDPTLNHSTLTDFSDLSIFRSAGSVGSSQATTPLGEPDAVDAPQRTTMHKVKPRSSIPTNMHIYDYAAQCVAAAEASRLSPYALDAAEHALLRSHISHVQVTTYLNIRNGILRLWLRRPHTAITRNEAIGCAKETRWFDLASVCFDFLVRRGYVNYGCVHVKETKETRRPGRPPLQPRQSVPVPVPVPTVTKRRKRIVIVGAGMSGLGCARQLDNLFRQYADEFAERGEPVPDIVVLEGRERIGGRVYSRALDVQPHVPHPDFPHSRCTADVGGMIVTGFDRGNPMNTLVRGQLGLGYHALLSTTTIYDADGHPVDPARDAMVENLFNECLDRVSEYKYKMPAAKPVQGNRDNIDVGRDNVSDGHRTMAQAEDAAAAKAVSGPSPGQTTPRVHNQTNHTFLKAAHKCRLLGWDLRAGVAETQDLDLDTITSVPGITFGKVVEEAIRQYTEMIELNAQDFRLLNWHIANLEYSNATNHNNLSLLAWDLDAGYEWDGKHSMVVGGYQSVARGLMMCPTPLHVRHKKVVKKVAYRVEPLASTPADDEYTPPVVLECEDGETVEADYVVNTIPLGVLKHGSVAFDPPLPPWKAEPIARIGFGVLNKIILTFCASFWDTGRDIFGVLRQPRNRFSLDQKQYARCRGRMFQWFNVTRTTGIPCLVALMAGDAAYEQERTSNDKLVAEAMAVLRSVYGADRVSDPIEVVVTRWASDRFARGSYSSAGPDMKVDDYDAMARPIGKHLHFAGEHTIGTYPATVHGAYLSGVRAAADLVEDLLGPIACPTPLVLPREDGNDEHKESKEHAETTGTTIVLKRKVAVDGTPGSTASTTNGTPNGTGGHRDAKATSRRRIEEREARIAEYIAKHNGERPLRPPKFGETSYLLFSRARHDDARRLCEAKAHSTRRPDRPSRATRVSPNDVRAVLSRMWRSAAPDERQPFAEQAAQLKKTHDEAVRVHEALAAAWDERASQLRADYVRDHPEDEAPTVTSDGPSPMGSLNMENGINGPENEVGGTDGQTEATEEPVWQTAAATAAEPEPTLSAKVDVDMTG